MISPHGFVPNSASCATGGPHAPGAIWRLKMPGSPRPDSTISRNWLRELDLIEPPAGQTAELLAFQRWLFSRSKSPLLQPHLVVVVVEQRDHRRPPHAARDGRVADRAHHVVGVDRAQERALARQDPPPHEVEHRAQRLRTGGAAALGPQRRAGLRGCSRESKRTSPPSNQRSRPKRSASAQPSAESSTTNRSAARRSGA